MKRCVTSNKIIAAIRNLLRLRSAQNSQLNSAGQMPDGAIHQGDVEAVDENRLVTTEQCSLRQTPGSTSVPAEPNAQPIGYACVMEDGSFVGVWKDREIADKVCAKQPASHHDRVIPIYSK